MQSAPPDPRARRGGLGGGPTTAAWSPAAAPPTRRAPTPDGCRPRAPPLPPTDRCCQRRHVQHPKRGDPEWLGDRRRKDLVDHRPLPRRQAERGSHWQHDGHGHWRQRKDRPRTPTALGGGGPLAGPPGGIRDGDAEPEPRAVPPAPHPQRPVQKHEGDARQPKAPRATRVHATTHGAPRVTPSPGAAWGTGAQTTWGDRRAAPGWPPLPGKPSGHSIRPGQAARVSTSHPAATACSRANPVGPRRAPTAPCPPRFARRAPDRTGRRSRARRHGRGGRRRPQKVAGLF